MVLMVLEAILVFLGVVLMVLEVALMQGRELIRSWGDGEGAPLQGPLKELLYNIFLALNLLDFNGCWAHCNCPIVKTFNTKNEKIKKS